MKVEENRENERREEKNIFLIFGSLQNYKRKRKRNL